MLKKKLNSIRPLIGIEDNLTLNRYGIYSLGFKLILNPVFSMTDDDYEKCAEAFNGLLKVLPELTITHKQDLFFHSKFEPKKINNEDLLYEGYKRKFFERDKMNHESYIFFSKGTSKIYNNNSANTFLFKSPVDKNVSSDQNYKDFISQINRAVQAANESGFLKLVPLKHNELKSLCEKYECLDFLQNYNYTADIYQDKNKTVIGKNFLSSLTINSLECFPSEYPDCFEHPSYKSTKTSLKFSLFYPIGLDLACNHIVNQIWIKDDKTIVKNKLKSNDNLNNSLRFVDDANEKNLNDSQAFSIAMEDGYHPISYHCNVMIWEDSLDQLSITQDIAFAAFSKSKFIPNISHNEILPLYWACYPGNASDIGYRDQTFLLLDRQAACLNIFETIDPDNINEFGIYLSDRITGCPVFVDPSDEPLKKGITTNRNKIIIGPSGSGKSVVCNHMVNYFLKTNTDVVIVDVGNSYKRLCELNKGKYLSFDPNDPIAFNPFSISYDDFTPEKQESLIQLIFTLWKKDPDDATKNEYTIISDSINEYYKHANINNKFLCFDTYFEFFNEIFFPKYNHVTDLFNIESFRLVLKPFYKEGQYHYLLNSKENGGLLKEPFIVFELDNIKDHSILFPVVTLVIMDTFISKMRLRKGRRKVILIEEAWKAIMSDGMAHFLLYLFKTCRKHFGEAHLVTQELNDLLKSEIVKETVIKNCGAKILLDMKEYSNDFDKIQTLLSLEKNAAEQVLSINKNKIENIGYYKEVCLVLGNQAKVYGVNISDEEYATYTTEKPEIEKIDDLKEKHGLELAIKLFAEERRNKRLG